MTIEDLILNAREGIKNNPTKTLASFYFKLFGYDRKFYGILGGMLKRYTPEIILESILDKYYSSGRRDASKRLQAFAEDRHQQNLRAKADNIPLVDLTGYLKEMSMHG